MKAFSLGLEAVPYCHINDNILPSWVCNGQKAIWLALGLSLVFQDGALVQIVFLKVLNDVTIT